MTVKNWFRVAAFLILPSFALNIATVVLVGGSLIELKNKPSSSANFLVG
ncbi:hypothetical protein SAMN05216338_109016 [Bradyrhizobium sp. Rc2d]|nr:hypothetical protein [Bradyrhizobium sp. Rc2d]SDK12411.1 hypothetical protein SAMN05216338_109016 [Bradyrhizobium sp. Rc2d]